MNNPNSSRKADAGFKRNNVDSVCTDSSPRNPHSSRATMKEQLVTWREDGWVRPFLSQYKKALVISLGLGVATMTFAAALMFTSGYLIDVSAEHPEYGVFAISAVLGFVQIFGIGKPFLGYFERLSSHDWVLRLTSSLRKNLYAKVESDALFWNATHKAGEALGLLAEDIGHIQNMYLRVVFPQVVATIIAVALTIGLGVFTPLLGLTAGPMLFCLVALVPLVSALVNGKRRLQAKKRRSEQYATAYDNISGIADWNFSGRKEDFISSMTAAYSSIRQAESQADAFDRKRDLVVQAFFCLLVLAVFTWAALYFGDPAQGPSQAGDLTRPANWIAAFVLGLFPLAEAFTPLSNAAVEMGSHVEALKHLNSIGAPKDSKDDQENDAIHHVYGSATTGSNQGEKDTIRSNGEKQAEVQRAHQDPQVLELHDVTFAYPGQGQPVLSHLDLRIPAKQKLAILGPSGTGKSTLAWLMRGDLQPQTGTITYGGSPVTEITDIYKVFGFIQQSPHLFNKTLASNLRLANPQATDDQLIEALHAVGLEPLLNRLPQGLKTMVDEAGLRFSGGERHRIALARILLADTPVVILDEPTVSLDPRTERNLLATVFQVLEGHTVIMITHHLAGVEHMDQVVFLEDCHVALSGSPAELATTSSRYQRLREIDGLQ